MIGRLVRGVGGAILCFALGTVIAEGIVVAWLCSSGRLDADTVAGLLAVLQGARPAEGQAPAVAAKDEPAPAAVPYEQVLDARAVKDKNLQFREMALAGAVAQLKADQRQLADAEKRYQQQLAAFNTRLQSVAQGAKTTGRDEVRRILEALKPKQAKELVLGMLENKEEDDVVVLLSGMTDSKRAKLLGEFKTPEETKKIEEVLRRIRQGVPEAPLAERAKEQLKQPGSPG
jgi:hypothetical protein